MSVLSFDIGIKNLCFCELDSKGKILDWGIVDISNDIPCEHKLKTGGVCCKPGTYIFNGLLDKSDMYLCTTHSKNKIYGKVKKFKNKKNDIFHVSQNLVKKLDEYEFNKRNIVDVIVENQPSLKNPTMKSIQMIVYSYFLIHGVCNKDSSISGLEMINARNKLKVYKGPVVLCPYENTKKNRYKINKYLAVKYCEKMIDKEDDKFKDLYNQSKKKDDLSDSYLQGIYFLNKRV